MAPTLMPGDRILIRLLSADAPLPAIDSLVVAWHPTKADTRMIKRLTSCHQGRLLLHGDNPSESCDSRQFGALERRQLIGVVTSIVRCAPVR